MVTSINNNHEELINKMKNRGIVPGLDAMNQLLDELGHPEDSLPVIHFAGTNGKGSTIAFLASILEEAGYRVGRYVSPAISCPEEIFQINGRPITKEALAEYYDRIEEAVNRLEDAGKTGPTYFEAETAIAFLYFRDQKVDYALVETGMGGLQDATNVIRNPLITVITSISYDHMSWLGDTLEEIAGQKAGIIKPYIPVVLAENLPEAAAVIRDRASVCHSELIEIRDDQYRVLDDAYDGSSFIWQDEVYRINLPGRHQISNAVTALTAAGLLLSRDSYINPAGEDGGSDHTKTRINAAGQHAAGSDTETRINAVGKHAAGGDTETRINPIGQDGGGGDTETHHLHSEIMHKGLSKARWPARLEIIGRDPLIYRDGAHNPDGASKLAVFLQKHFTNSNIIYIIGVLKDKEYEKMLAYLIPLGQKAYVFKPDNARGLDAETLARCIRSFGKEAVICENVTAALGQALDSLDREDVLVVCGSLSFMGELNDFIGELSDYTGKSIYHGQQTVQADYDTGVR